MTTASASAHHRRLRPEEGTITLVIQAVGKSTKEMQQVCKVGTGLYG